MNLHFALNPAWTDGFDLFRGHVDFNAEEQSLGLPATIPFTGLVGLEPGFLSGEVCLEFPKLDDGIFPEPKACRRILLFSFDEVIEAVDEVIAEPNFMRVAEHFPRLFTEQDWSQVSELYRLARTHLAETCDLLDFDELPFAFHLHHSLGQPEADQLTLRDLYAHPLAQGTLDGKRWFIDELYSPARKTGSLRVTVEFRTTEDGLEPDLTDEQYEALNDDPEGHPEFHCPSVTFLWDLDSGDVTETARNKTEVPVASFLDLLLQVIPDARERFRRRHQHLANNVAKIPAWREIQRARIDTDDEFSDADSINDGFNPYGTYTPPPPPAPIVRAAPKVGRNDPCPCGSGKKAKKCCGAS
jgi:hypothetical protein